MNINIKKLALHRIINSFNLLTLSIFILFALASCTSQSSRFEYNAELKSDYYLQQYETDKNEFKTNWLLLAIRASINEENTSQAQYLLEKLPEMLTEQQQNEVVLLKFELAIKKDTPAELSKRSFNSFTDEQKIRYYNAKISFDTKNKNYNNLIRDYIEVEQYGTKAQQKEAIDKTWYFLISLTPVEIDDIFVYLNEPTLQGWMNLIYAYNSIVYTDDNSTKKELGDALQDRIREAVNDWKKQYFTHPAALNLPAELSGDQTLSINHEVKKIALFLPLSGPSKTFGEALKYGYNEASNFYANESKQKVTVYDTNSAPLEQLLSQAKTEGADLIVGPLLKNNIDKMLKLKSTIPVLALNQLDNLNDKLASQKNKNSAQFCYFALSPEDEAANAAVKMHKQGKRRPLLIVQNNDLGKRIVNAFIAKWNTLDIEPLDVHVQFYESEKSLRRHLNEGKGIELEGTLANNLHKLAEEPNNSNENAALKVNEQEHVVKHETANLELSELEINESTEINTESSKIALLKADAPTFDSIYIGASYDELLLIKSMLDMPSNNQLVDNEGKLLFDKNGKKLVSNKKVPDLYASSKIHVSNANKDFSFDVDGLQFTEIPLLTDKRDLVKTLPSYITNDYSLIRLYAMGVDAWRLANHFNELKSNKGIKLDGLTGELSTNDHCEIKRELNWVKYQNGNIVY